MKNNKKRMISVIIVLLVVVEITTMFLMYKSLSNKEIELDNVSINKVDKKAFAVLLEQEDGTYQEVESWPNDGYIYDSDKSGCMDENGNKIENALEYDSETNVVNLQSNKTTYCYLYFKQPMCFLASDSTVSKGLEGAKYRCKVDPNKDRYTFYLIDNNTDGTSDLIMNANINASGEAVIPGVTSDTGLVAWYADEQNNINGPVTAMTYLHNATKSWTNVKPLNYTYNDRETQGGSYGYQSIVSTNGIATITKGDTSNTTVTIGSDTEPIRARMPIYSSDANVTEVTSMSNASYLYDNLDQSGRYEPYGYWTLSSYADSSYDAWYADCIAVVELGSVVIADGFGVRPVITVKL